MTTGHRAPPITLPSGIHSLLPCILQFLRCGLTISEPLRNENCIATWFFVEEMPVVPTARTGEQPQLPVAGPALKIIEHRKGISARQPFRCGHKCPLNVISSSVHIVGNRKPVFKGSRIRQCEEYNLLTFLPPAIWDQIVYTVRMS